MTLAGVRERFVKESGRTDLVVDTTNYKDDGADFYIQAGQRFLDDFPLENPKTEAEVDKDIVQGDTSVAVVRVRAVLDVRLKETGETPNSLERVPYRRFLETYGDEAYLSAEASAGAPARYTLGIKRSDTPTTATEEEHLIIFHPPSDGAYTLTVLMEYFSASLEKDGDESWWSIVYPEALILAARRQLEVAHRNNTGVQEYNRRIREKLLGIDSNVVSEKAHNRTQMNNAW